ncbi:hypothetical protein [Burkholderia gladioli]|uniref:hypothetical protein n=1 Tax=Burkholderia gladioli TaxID=28095 RepID=UPI003EE11152
MGVSFFDMARSDQRLDLFTDRPDFMGEHVDPQLDLALSASRSACSRASSVSSGTAAGDDAGMPPASASVASALPDDDDDDDAVVGADWSAVELVSGAAAVESVVVAEKDESGAGAPVAEPDVLAVPVLELGEGAPSSPTSAPPASCDATVLVLSGTASAEAETAPALASGPLIEVESDATVAALESATACVISAEGAWFGSSMTFSGSEMQKAREACACRLQSAESELAPACGPIHSDYAGISNLGRL